MVQELPGFVGQERQVPQHLAGANLEKQKIRLGLFSCGLGSINRGFEISTARFFKAVSQNGELDARLFAGADYPGAEKVWCRGRNEWLRFPLGLLSFLEREQLWKIAYCLEQTSYSFGLIHQSRQSWQPDVVWTKEVPLAHVLYEFRRISGNPYKIIFANGGGFRPSTYQQFDFIQHLHPEAYEEARTFGIPAEKMNVLPNLVPYQPPTKRKSDLRAEYGYAQDDWIVICVAAWNSHHKRIDYLIDEVAKIDDQRCKLLICGQPEPEGENLQKLAAEKLGTRARFLTVAEGLVQELLSMSDVFVLCSLYEGLGAVMIEAAMAGLPIVCHPHGGSRYILQEESCFLDLTASGNLARRLSELRQKPLSPAALQKIKESVRSRFNEDKLRTDFENMVKNVHGVAAVQAPNGKDHGRQKRDHPFS